MFSMSVKYTGKKMPHDSIVMEGCLGPREAELYLNNSKPSTELVAGVTTEIADVKPRLGEKRMSFDPGYHEPTDYSSFYQELTGPHELRYASVPLAIHTVDNDSHVETGAALRKSGTRLLSSIPRPRRAKKSNPRAS